MDAAKSGVMSNAKDDISMGSEEKKVKQDDDSTISSAEDTLMKAYNPTDFVFKNIRFTPKMIEFLNAFEGKQFSEKMTIQNIGRNPVLVKIGEPKSFIFQLKKPSLRTRFLPAGASITKTITYTYHSDDLVQRSHIPIQINGLPVDFPIIVKRAEPEIEVHPQKLDFKAINLGASAKSMMLTIRNTGGRRTNFKVDCGKHLDLVVSPMRGTVKPKHSVDVCVEIMGFREGEYYRELWIKTTESPIRVPVLVEVVMPRLEIVYPTGTDNFTLINFRPTFKGTQRVSSFLLKNVSNETTMFAAFAEVDGKVMSLKEGKRLSESFSMFLMTVEDGILAPFETRIFNVVFSPKHRHIEKGWHHEECRKKSTKGKSECDQIAFLCIRTLYYIEKKELAKVEGTNLRIAKPDLTKADSVTSDIGKSTLKVNTSAAVSNSEGQREPKSLRFCLRGQALDPDILIQPSCLEFGELSLGQTENRVLRLKNNSKIGVRCKMCKMVNITTEPQSIWLKSEKSHEFLIRLTPKCGGVFNLKLRIQILAQSDLLNGKVGLETIASYTVPVTYIANYIFKTPAPKLGLGITPLVVDDVGFQRDCITYKDVSKLPYTAMLGLKKGFKPLWMKEEKAQVKNVDNALVALPNDRPRLFYSWPKDKVCRSIFKGFFRYSPPEDLAYTLSPEGRLQKKERYAIWAEYLSKKLQELNHPSLKEVEHLGEEFSWRQHHTECHNLIGIQDPKKISADLPKLPLIPLSPLFLFRINVEPKMISYSLVPVSCKTYETITVDNQNPFPVHIRFNPGNANVTLLNDKTMKIPPLSRKSVKVFFESKEFGRYFGFLNYVINGAHEFKITISAFVTSKSLFINSKCCNLEFKKYGPKEPFQATSIFLPLENKLPSPVKYRMLFLEDSAYMTPITEGEVPEKTTVLTEILLILTPGKSFYSEISVTSESGQTELVKLFFPLKKILVDFLHTELDMGDIPLNLPTKARPIILNACYHDVSFELVTSQPMPEVTVTPKSGIIRARSYFYLEITVKIPVAMKFCFDVVMNVNFSHRITLCVSGNVVIPLITVRPFEVMLDKIWDHSYDTFTICASNEGTTRAELKMDFTRCPEHLTVEGDPEILLPPHQTQRITFRFTPNSGSRYVFYLPFIINHILGPPMIQEQETEFSSYFLSEHEKKYAPYGNLSSTKVMLPCIPINCIVIDALLYITPLNVVFRKQNSGDLQFQPQDIEIRNVSDEKVAFCIDMRNLGEEKESSFEVRLVQPSLAQVKEKSIKASLLPGQEILLRATFTPQKYGIHTIEVPLHVKGYNRGIPYNNIRLCGSLESPRILPTSSEVYFPPLPLGVACEVIVTICTENYRHSDTLQCLIWEESRESQTSLTKQITTKWLTEPHITGNCGRHSFQLQITFESFAPVALRNYLVLIDSAGMYSTILVSAVADNTPLTIYTFLTKKASKYKLQRDEDVYDFLKTEAKSELKFQGHSKSTVDYYTDSANPEQSETVVETTDKGPILIVELTKSMSRISQLDFATVLKSSPKYKETPSDPKIRKALLSNNPASQSDSALVPKLQVQQPQGHSTQELPYPSFPTQDNIHWAYFHKLLVHVERWIFEVVMRCDHYFSIPDSFQRIMNNELNPQKTGKKTFKEKDFLYFLDEIFDSGKFSDLPKRPCFADRLTASDRVAATRTFFAELLQFLQNRGCLLPHVRPEYLMEYDEYEIYTKLNENVEVFSWEKLELKKMDEKGDSTVPSKMERDVIPKEISSVFLSNELWGKSSDTVQYVNGESEKMDDGYQELVPIDQKLESFWNLLGKKPFQHQIQVLDQATFHARSTQAWLDIVIQVFRVFVLSRLTKKYTIPEVKIYEMSDKVIVETAIVSSVLNYCKNVRGNISFSPVESYRNNIYTTQERILLAWLNHHLQAQRDILWQGPVTCEIRNRVLNNFDKDLSDSLALISLTAAHCPYIVPIYFRDVFPRPDTPNKILHNAARLVQAWRTLQLGISVDTRDITKPNSVFMIMILTHLYEVLPSLHPRQCICFSAPLNSKISRTIVLKNESQYRLLYEGKLFGEDQRFFSLKESLIEIKPQKSATITVIFSVNKIQKISATLFLSGRVVSPDFGMNMAFYLEGEPSAILEYEKMSFTASLYKVICAEIPVKSPYKESAKYEVWYTTKKPVYSDELSLKPWSSIRKAKVSRRLFLNSSEIEVQEGMSPPTLSMTVACLCPKKRQFWLMFRSEIGDFIILVEINAKQLDEPLPAMGYYSELWSPSVDCTCSEKCTRKFDAACPFVAVLKIPIRNNALWNALRKMFCKSLGPHEEFFWDKHFEMDIGLCLILWFLSHDEEEEVLDEFVEVLSTRVTFTLQVDPPDKEITLPAQLEIPDVREDSEIDVPMHISKNTPESFKLIMTSESKKEIRILKVTLQQPNAEHFGKTKTVVFSL